MLERFLPKSTFARGLSVLVGGTATAQLITILSSPLLTRLYKPDDFGLLAVYASVLSLFTVVASLRYQLTIPLPESDEEAIHLVVLCIFITLLTTTLSGALVIFWGPEFVQLLNSAQLLPYLWLIPVGVLFAGLYQAFNYWSIRTKEFKILAKTKIWQKIANALIQIVGFKFGIVALISGQAVGQGAGVTSLAKSALKHESFWRWHWKDLWKQAVRFKHFPMFSTWSGFANTAGVQLPPILFASIFGPSIAGFYMLAHRILSMPMSFIGKAIGDVFLAHAAEAHHNNKLKPLFEMVAGRLIMIAMPIVVVIMIDAPTLFSVVFGKEWEEAGMYARWLALWLGMVLICSPLSTIFTVLEKQVQGMVFQMSMTIARIGVIFVGITTGDVITTIILFSLVGTIFWFGFLCWAAIQSQSSMYFVVKQMLINTILALLLSFPFFLGSYYFKNSYIWWASGAVSAVMIIFYYFYKLKNINNES